MLKAEQVIRQQDVAIRLLQARDGRSPAMASIGLPVGAAQSLDGYRDRSRSPRPPVFTPLAFTPLSSVKPSSAGDMNMSTREFAMANNLDEKCLEVLNNQSLEVQQYVIGQGPAEGRNPSAMVMSRIAKCGGGDLSGGATPAAGGHAAEKAGATSWHGAGADFAEVEEFILGNGLDEKCAEAFRSQTVDCQAAVIAQGPAEGRNASAMVMGRIAKFMRGEL